MSDPRPQHERPGIESLSREVMASYEAEPRTRRLDAVPLPDRGRTFELLKRIRDLLFPGYFCDHRLTTGNVRDHVLRLLAEIRESLEQRIAEAVAYRNATEGGGDDPLGESTEAERLTDAFLQRIPELRRMLAMDVQAAYDGDPAATDTDETIICYPGVLAVLTYRVAHELHRLGVPLLPRLLTEHTHSETGIDIHPGATIGQSFFIDHGTGVVIGETTEIGDRVKLYQGVTLGAMSFPRDETGRLIRGTKRHPTIEDDVIVYANATILGGSTIVGKGCVIGGSVFLTKSVPPEHYVTLKSQELRYRSAETHHRLTTVPRPGEERS